MLGIVTTNSPGQCNPFSLYPYRRERDVIANRDVFIYTITPCFRPLLPAILKRLQKKHPKLILSEELRNQAESFAPLFFQRIKTILSLTHPGSPRKIAILCKKEEHRLGELLEALSPFAQSVNLVTDVPTCLDAVSEEALKEYGLTVTQRGLTQIKDTDLILLLSGNFQTECFNGGSLINLSDQPVCATVPVLSAISNQAISAFFARHPHLRVNPSALLSETDPVTHLIWKYC